MQNSENRKITKCHQCGMVSNDEMTIYEDKYFCCDKCKKLNENNSGNKIDPCCSNAPGTDGKLNKLRSGGKFDYLDDKDIQGMLIEFTNNNISSVTFTIPNIQCTSCIGVLEKLYSINPGIINSNVEFLKKKLRVLYNNVEISLKEIVKILSSIGYEPLISEYTNKDSSNKIRLTSKELYIKIGVAGFCLGNIMLLSFPEYLSSGSMPEDSFKTVFNYLNILLSLPVFFYCSSGYFKSAWKGLRQKYVSIDLPISLGIAALFIRSIYEIIIYNNAGFVDSLAGLVFLLLLGKLFQSKTYESLNFERDYKSYFPVSVTVKTDKCERSIPVSKLKPLDRIIVRNNEIVPADAILFRGSSNIDYSFVTGESIPEQKVLGEIIYAGGRHFGGVIELEVLRTVSQSYLTQLWNDPVFKKDCKSALDNLTNLVSKYFTFVVLGIAFAAAIYWMPIDMSTALDVFTTVLIVACPCALALTTPFALGNTLRIFGKNKFYLKNASVVESLSKIDSVVFDKTGTITDSKNITVSYTGVKLGNDDLAFIKSLTRNSSHPLSKIIYDTLDSDEYLEVDDFTESVSEGISCDINGNIIKMGSTRFILGESGCTFHDLKHEFKKNIFSPNVFLSINNYIKGYFSFKVEYREGLNDVVKGLSGYCNLSLISGDNDSEKDNLKKYFSDDDIVLFNMKPVAKLKYIKNLQSKGNIVMMVGDGLNDAGALKQSNVGISVSEDITNFSPSCDGIIEASDFSKLGKFVQFSKSTMKVIKVSFAISFLYNVVGLFLAANGVFSPLIAAVLMPFNSISIILFVLGATNFIARRRKLL